jgi:O-antigen/teichoic acid export membrane protein
LIGNKKLFGSVTLLLGGTVISQIIPVLFTPLLSRIYSPGEFGSLGLFMAATSLLGIISSGMFELSIMLPKSNLKAFRIVGLSVFHALLFTIFITLLLVFFFDKLDMIGWHLSWSDTVILLPLSVFSYALFQSLSYWVNRMGKYKVLSKIRIIQSLTIVGSSLLFGFLNFSFNGLIVGYFLGFVVCIISWLIIIFKRFVLNGYEFNSQIYNIGNSENIISINELAMLCIDISKSNVHIKHIQYSNYFSNAHRDILYRKPNCAKMYELYKPKYTLIDTIRNML